MPVATVTGAVQIGPSGVSLAGNLCDLLLGVRLGVTLGDKLDVKVAALTTVTVNLNSIATAKVLALSTTAAVRAKLTSAGGVEQVVPLSKVAVLVSETEPFTALKLDGGSADAIVTVLLGGEPA